MHRLKLIEASCLALCHLVLLGSSEDLNLLEQSISDDLVERIEHFMESAKRRISPEKASVFYEAFQYCNTQPLQGNTLSTSHRETTINLYF